MCAAPPPPSHRLLWCGLVAAGLRGPVNVFKFSREALERSDLPPSVVSAVPPFMVSEAPRAP